MKTNHLAAVTTRAVAWTLGEAAALAAVVAFFTVAALTAQLGRGAGPTPASPDLLPLPEMAAGPTAATWNYVLLPGSRLTDDCPVCDRIPIVAPMRGTFRLRLLEENPLFSTYAMEEIVFDATTLSGLTYKVRGQGTYQFGGEVAQAQDMFLEVSIDNGAANKLCYFTNADRVIPRGWPLIRITVGQTNGTMAQQYTLDLLAAPVREIWFSTTYGFHPGTPNPPAPYVSPGDLVSSAGHVVKSNGDLTRYLGIQPIVPDLGLDGVDVLPGGEIAFSVEQSAFSETLGVTLRNGDVLTDRGRVLRAASDLIAAFVPQPPLPDDLGLDALQIMDSGEVYFSVKTGFFSERLGRMIGRGDLLSDQGRVVKSNADLLAAFRPPPILRYDYGLDAVHVWPSGEVWFSLEEGFSDAVLGEIKAGDLLSDRGEVIVRNLDLLAAFQPLEDLADFGLDALYIVSDSTPPGPPGRCTSLGFDPGTGALRLEWTSQGHVFQLEKAAQVTGPYVPVSPITSDLIFTDPAAGTSTPSAFYRLRQW